MSGPHFMPLNPDESYAIRIRDDGPNSMRSFLREYYVKNYKEYTGHMVACKDHDCPVCEFLGNTPPNFANPFFGLETE